MTFGAVPYGGTAYGGAATGEGAVFASMPQIKTAFATLSGPTGAPGSEPPAYEFLATLIQPTKYQAARMQPSEYETVEVQK